MIYSLKDYLIQMLELVFVEKMTFLRGFGMERKKFKSVCENLFVRELQAINYSYGCAVGNFIERLLHGHTVIGY